MNHTNKLVLKVINDIEDLMDWCAADESASLDAGAKGQAKEDKSRYRRLLKARKLISECHK